MTGFRDAMKGFRVPLPATSLARRVGPERRMVLATEPLHEAGRAAHTLGVTVNDLVLAVVTDGMRELLSGRGRGSTVCSCAPLCPWRPVTPAR